MSLKYIFVKNGFINKTFDHMVEIFLSNILIFHRLIKFHKKKSLETVTNWCKEIFPPNTKFTKMNF